MSREELSLVLEPSLYIGRSAEQTEEYIDGFVKPVLIEYKDKINKTAELFV